MLDYQISFERPWVFALFALAALLILLPYFLTPRNKRRSFGRICALVIRTIVAAVAIFLLSGVSITEEVPTPQDEAIVYVVDYSDSLYEISDRVEAYVGTLLEAKAPTTRVRLIKFSGNAVTVTSSFTTDGTAAYEEFSKNSAEGMEPTDSTNIKVALESAGQLLKGLESELDSNEHVYKRVVLISDGRETTGSAWEAAAKLDADSIRLDTVNFDVTTDVNFAEVSMLSLGVLPDNVVESGTTVRLQVKLYSTINTDGVLHFFDGDEEVDYYPVSITAGNNTFSMSYKTSSDSLGLHELRVRFEAKRKKDAIQENNELGTWIKVTGTPRILLVGSETQTAVLHDQIKNIYDADRCTAREFPNTMKELLRYDEVVLMDVSQSADAEDRLPDYADEMLNTFVHDIGRGLLTTSGMTQATYQSYTEENSLLADMLPVSMTLDETEHNIAIVIVIDDSSSMIPGHYNTTGVDKFQPALDGAQRVIESLGKNDYVGVVTFHQEATVQLELTKAENPQELIEVVQSLDAINHFNTDYSKGMNAARDMLINFDGARSKHVIFLTDGYPNQGDYSQLPSSMKNAGITLSTIALLTDGSAKNLLSGIAQDGGGNAYAIDKEEDLDNLADIMEDLTVEAKEPQFVNTDPFHPLVGDDTGVLNQVRAADMTLGGYIGSTVKSGADMPLQTKDFRPLIAEWDWGRGHITTLMMDLTSTWCEAFFEDENIIILKNLVTQSLNEEVKTSGISVTAKQSDRLTHLTATTICDEPNKDHYVKVFVYDNPDFFFDSKTVVNTSTNLTEPVFFNPESEGRRGLVLSSADGTIHKATLDLAVWAKAMEGEELPVLDEPADTNRTYYLCFVQYALDEVTDGESTTLVEGGVMDYVVVAYSGGILAEYDIYNLDGRSVLEGISAAGGGQIMTSTNDLYSIVKDGAVEYSLDIMFPATVLIAVLLMMDILIRNIHFGRRNKKK